ncbi:DUF6214 family protein [Streptomyces sp. NBC_01136]|uniref:DUF6214 family protein n=1 Tax=unclassified Streptomyces TaxID=2593676 RepID=UPI003248E1A8|nr:DUF6214 family protein [Streptomyces sp. NBC_01136]
MSVWPAWEVREHDRVTRWFSVRLAFGDGAHVDALAVLTGDGVSIEDVRARPPLSLDDLAALADWIEGPLFAVCGTPAERVPSRARPAWPGGTEGRRLVAEEYRSAQEEGVDPVLAVMCATGHSRRRALRLIAGARDEGFLTPRHARR